MMCPACQQENPPQSNFCVGCGARLVLTCASCGADLPPESRFCNKCGGPVKAQVVGQSRFKSPEAYTPKHLAEKILTSRSALEGERKQVTVLFADLKGSMELLADRDPEEARKLLDPVLERMMEAVHRYEGTVNQVMGDGIMALFGAPLAHEDHAVRACYAALRMQESVKRYAEEVRRSRGVTVRIRVGLNSGEVVVRAIGSDLHMDYTAVGQTTHLAARMEQLADPGSILLSPDTLRLVEGYGEVKPLGPVPVKGLTEPVEVYELTGAGPARTRLQAAARRGFSRFVGRDAEVEQLRRALQHAGDGHGQIVAVVGEPGVGKSRLFYEFTRSHRTRESLILESGSVSYGKATAYLPVIHLLKAYFRIQDRDDHRQIREKVIGKLLALDSALEPTLPAFLALLDVPVEDAQWQALDPPQRRQRTLDAVKRLLLRESQAQPLLLLFEDLHWIDSETQTVLDSLIESVPSSRVLLLVNYRPEYQHGWGNKTYYTQLRIDPLPPASAEELLRGLLGDDRSLGALRQLLIGRTEGNPFFLEESVRTLIETHVLIGERGAHRLANDVTTIQVAPTVQAVLAARIDRLPPEEKRLLQSAAVIGKDVPFALLQAIAEVPDEDLRRSLTHLQVSEFISETRLFPDLEYTFRHALTHEVAYGSLLQDRRRVLHARIVEAIEKLHVDRLDEQVERLAHHAVRGEVWEKAVSYFRQAGAKEAARAANREAVGYFEQALAALKHLPERRDTLVHAIDLRLDLRTSLYPLAELPRILDCLREAETLATALNDQRRLGKVADYMSHYFWWTGDQDRAIDSGQRALSVAADLGDFALQVTATLYLGRAYLTVGDYRRAVDLLRRNVEFLQGDRTRERLGLIALPSVASRTWLLWCFAELGEFAEGILRGEEGLQIAEGADHPYSIMLAHFGVGRVYLSKGDFAKAIPALERALALSRVWNIPIWFPLIASALGSAYSLSGRVAEALSLLHDAAEQATSRGIKATHSVRVALLGEAYLETGRLDEANELAQEALELAHDHKERGNQAGVFRLLGEIASHRDPPDAAEAAERYGHALALAEGLGMRPLVAHCHLGLGTLYRRTGKREQAERHLSTATAMFSKMDMRFWLEKAEAESRELGA